MSLPSLSLVLVVRTNLHTHRSSPTRVPKHAHIAMARTLLHDTVKELHNLLQLPNSTPLHQFDAQLRHAVHNVFTLLGLSSRQPHRLDISTSVFEPFLLVYFVHGGAAVQDVDFDNDNIYLFLKDDTASALSSTSLFDQLLTILAEPHSETHRLARLKQTYARVIARFSELVQFFLKLHRNTKNELQELIVRCFAYEYSYYLKLKSQLDEEQPDNGSHRMVLALDSFIRKNPQDESLDTDSLFTDDLDHGSFLNENALGFESLDPSFAKLYQVFFQLALVKSLGSFYQDSSSYVKVMIELFKSSYGIDYFERDTQRVHDLKTVNICQFFLGSDDPEQGFTAGFVPARFQELARNIIEEIYESSRLQHIAESMSDLRVSDETKNQGAFELLQDELVELISNLKTVVSVLNEYGLGFDPNFSGAFRSYLYLVCEVHDDLASPEDIAYITEITKTVATIVNFENHGNEMESDFIQETVYRLLGMQSRLLTAGADLTLLMRAAFKEVEVNGNLSRRVLTEWSHRLLEIIQLEAVKSVELTVRTEKTLKKRMLSLWYNKRVRNQKILSQAAIFSNKRTLSNFLTSYWLKRIIVIANASNEADLQSLRPFLALWKSKHRLSEENLKEVAMQSNMKLEQHMLNLWLAKSSTLYELHQTAQEFRQKISKKNDKRIKSEVFSAILERFRSRGKRDTGYFPDDDSLSQKLAQLGEREKNYTIKKTWDFWIHKLQIAQSYEDLASSKKRRHKKHAFELWKKHYRMKHAAAGFERQRNKVLLSFVLTRWNMVTVDRKKGDLLHINHLKKRVIDSWRLNRLGSDTRAKVDERLLRSMFKTWKLKYHFVGLSEKFDSKIKVQALDTWVDKVQLNTHNLDSAINFQERYLREKALRLWCSKSQLMVELERIADLNFQRKHLLKLVQSGRRIRAYYDKADQYLDDRPSVSDKISLQAVMVKWSERYMKNFDSHTLKALQSFEQHVRVPGIMSVYFSHWRTKRSNIDRAKLQLERRLRQHLKTSSTRRSYFELWTERLQERLDDDHKSSKFYENLLHKRYLLAWYEKYATDVEYLNDVAQQIIDKKDYLKMVDYLRTWNLRYIKNVQRNQQTCEIFAKKWEKTHMRSMLELWLHKTRHKPGDAADNDYTDANTSFGSIYSPLAKKNRGVLSGPSLLDEQSYLSTPVKKQTAKNFLTPFSKTKGPSPTRLQETNQRMKFDRMDALTTRYRLAKDGASRSAILRTTRSTRLPPPQATVAIPERPPAPMFDVASSRSVSPNASSSPAFTPRLLKDSTSSSSLDHTILSTAKRLHKIRPLVVPPAEDDLQELQYSSASELKQRLLSPTRPDIFNAT